MTESDRVSVVHHASGALEFVDEGGTRWTVSEIAPVEFSERLLSLLPHPERRRGWLLFESALGERRRYTPIPENWRDLPSLRLQECVRRAVIATVMEQRRREDQDR